MFFGNDSQILRGLCSHKSSLHSLSKDWFCGGGGFNLGQNDRTEADCAVAFPVQWLAKLELEMSSIYSKYEGFIVTFAWRELNKQMKRGATIVFDNGLGLRGLGGVFWISRLKAFHMRLLKQP
jgi:hypothetical protein